LIATFRPAHVQAPDPHLDSRLEPALWVGTPPSPVDARNVFAESGLQSVPLSAHNVSVGPASAGQRPVSTLGFCGVTPDIFPAKAGPTGWHSAQPSGCMRCFCTIGLRSVPQSARNVSVGPASAGNGPVSTLGSCGVTPDVFPAKAGPTGWHSTQPSGCTQCFCTIGAPIGPPECTQCFRRTGFSWAEAGEYAGILRCNARRLPG